MPDGDVMGVGVGEAAAAKDGNPAVVSFGVSGFLNVVVLHHVVGPGELNTAAAGSFQAIVFDDIAETTEGGFINGKTHGHAVTGAKATAVVDGTAHAIPSQISDEGNVADTVVPKGGVGGVTVHGRVIGSFNDAVFHQNIPPATPTAV